MFVLDALVTVFLFKELKRHLGDLPLNYQLLIVIRYGGVFVVGFHFPDHPRKGEPLKDQCDKNDDESDEEDEVAIGERLSLPNEQGYGQSHCQRYNTPHPSPANNHRVSPPRIGVSNRDETAHQSGKRGSSESAEHSREDKDEGNDQPIPYRFAQAGIP